MQFMWCYGVWLSAFALPHVPYNQIRLCPQPRLTVVRKHASGGAGGGGSVAGTPPEGSLGSSWSRGASPPGAASSLLLHRMHVFLHATIAVWALGRTHHLLLSVALLL